VQLPEPGIWLVEDPDDTPESTHALHALADLDEGVVVVRVTPGPRRLHTVAMDVLTALGKDPNGIGVVRVAEENWRRCAAWLSAERVQHLIVDRAETLQPNRWQDFIGIASHCGVSLWLIAHGASLTRGQREMLEDWPLTQVPFEQFIADRTSSACDGPQGDGRAAHAPPAAPFPTLPTSDFTTFRADCRLLLSPDAFARVEVEMQDAAAMTRQWLADGRELDGAAMKHHLRELIEDCRSTGQALARLRAAQAVCLIEGLLVRVDLERLAGSTQTARPLVDHQLVGQLRAYSSTHLAAVALVACLTGASPEAITRLNVGDVTEDAIGVAGRSFPVPDVAWRVLAAHLHQRRASGALPEDALFSDGQRGALGDRSTPRAIRMAMRNVAKASGLMLWGERNSRDDLSQGHWLQRRGVSVRAVR